MFSAPHTQPSLRSRQFAGTYHQVGVQTMVAGASAHGLVMLLFDGFIAAVHRAKGALRQQDVAAKGLAIGSAVRIVDERLTQANLRGDEAALDECLALVAPLREAWAAIADQADAASRN